MKEQVDWPGGDEFEFLRCVERRFVQVRYSRRDDDDDMTEEKYKTCLVGVVYALDSGSWSLENFA
jgi:hypothetical protein